MRRIFVSPMPAEGTPWKSPMTKSLEPILPFCGVIPMGRVARSKVSPEQLF